MAHLLYLAHGTHQVFAAEQLSRASTQLAAYHILVQTVVTADADFVDGGLVALEYAHLQVYRVAHDVHFHRVEGVEQVAVVVVQVACYVAQIVLLPFVYLHEHVHGSVVILADTVAYDDGVAVSQFIVLVDYKLFVGLIVLFHELFGTEQVSELPFFVGFLHYPFQLFGCQGLVAHNLDMVHLYLLFLVNLYVYNYLVLVGQVVLLCNYDFSVLEAFVIEIAFYQGLCTVYQIRGYLTAFYQADFFLQVFTFGLLHTMVTYFGHTGPHGQVDGEPHAVAYFLVGGDAHVGKQAVPPVALAGLSGLVAR